MHILAVPHAGFPILVFCSRDVTVIVHIPLLEPQLELSVSGSERMYMSGEDGKNMMLRNLRVLAKDSGQKAKSKDDCRMHGKGKFSCLLLLPNEWITFASTAMDSCLIYARFFNKS